MAITGRPKGNERTDRGASSARRSSRFAFRRHAVLAATAACACVASPPVFAQKWSIDGGVGADLVWTSNANLGEGEAQSDSILDVNSHIRLLAQGQRLKVSGTAALDALVYARHTQPNRLLPSVDLLGNLEAIERFLFLEAGVRSAQTSANAFGPRPDTNTTTANSVTTTQVRFVPMIEGSVGETLKYRLRSENSWSYNSGSTAASTSTGPDDAGYFSRNAISVDRTPRPWGWRIEAERSETRYRDDTQEPLILNLGRATARYAVTEEFTFGIHGGVERSNFTADSGTHSLYGVDARWEPSPRTTLTLFDERRFFGNSWSVAFDHRSPQVAWNFVSSRLLNTSAQALFDLPAGQNVTTLLDAMFTTRYPDPLERARVVQDFIANQGLPTSTLQPISLQSQRVSLATLHSATVTFLSPRNSVALTVYLSRTEDLPDSTQLSTGSALTNNTQYGTSLSLSHRLTPTMTLIASADWSRISTLDDVASEERTTQRNARVRLTVDLSRRTIAYGGARFSTIDSNTATNGHEASVFVGMSHRF